MTAYLLSYLGALLLFFAGLSGLFIFIKRHQKIKLHWGMYFLGIIVSLFFAAIIMLLWSVTFNNINYYNTTGFKTLVGFVYLVVLCTLRYLFVHLVFFAYGRDEKAHSFSYGYGSALGILMSVYLLIMFFVLVFNGIFNRPFTFNAETGQMMFADLTVISVFPSAVGHISVLLAFLFLAVISVCSSVLLRRINRERCRFGIPVIWPILAILIEAGAMMPLPFFAMYGLRHWQLPLILGILAALLVVLTRFVPLTHEETTYKKQFE